MRKSPDITTILFDFDGTLADTVRAGVAAFNEIAERYGFLAITAENVEVLRGQGPRAVMKALSIPMIRVPTVLRSLRSGVKSALPTIGFTNGMRAAIGELKAKGYRLGIVTSNSAENVLAFLKKNDADFFDFIQAGTGIFNKGSKIKKLMVREGLKKDETVFVGDEIRDLEAARKSGLAAIAVTWGLNSREGLVAAGAEVVVDRAQELVELF